jgi:two-component system sensor histidine kinase BarA
MNARPLTTFGLLVAAFASILLTLVLTGIAIEREALLVHAQTREILENGLPSIVSATRMKEILPSLRLAPMSFGEEKTQREQLHDAAAERFRLIFTAETHANSFFPNEREALAEIQRLFAKLSADEQAVRQGHFRDDSTRARYRADWTALSVITERFEALNETGIQVSKTALEAVAAQEERVLLLGVIGCLCLAALWAVLLSRLIAGPLRTLDAVIGRLPGNHAAFELADLPPAAAEIRALGGSLHEMTRKLRDADLERARSQYRLEEAFQREGELNRDLAQVNSSLDQQVKVKTAALETANMRLSELIEELQQRDRSRSSFLATISHELRTPIAVIKASMVTLQNVEISQEAEARLLYNAASEADHLGTLVEDLLDVARMDAGSFRIAPSPHVALEPIVNAVVGGLATLFEDQDIQLVRDVPGPLPEITADAERIRQVLRNLLENAAKFSPEGTTVTLVIALKRPETGCARIMFEVADQGPGVAPELVAGLFQPFVQHGTSRRAQGGVGLGLAIAKQLVSAHGGAIGHRPNSSGGSVFWFWLPAEV